MARPVKYTSKFIENEAAELAKYMDSAPIPFLKDFCVKRGYPSSYISRFAKNETFCKTLLIYKDKIESTLVLGGLKGSYNSFMVFNTLKNVAGWRDKKDVEHSGNLDLKSLLLDDNDSNLQQSRSQASVN